MPEENVEWEVSERGREMQIEERKEEREEEQREM